MQKFKNNYLFFYLSSVSLHALLFLFAVIFLNRFHDTPTLGDTTEQVIISAQLVIPVQAEIHSDSSHQLKKLEMDSRLHRNDRLSNKDNKQKNNKQNKENNHNVSVASSHQTGVQTQELLALLHAAIQAQQRYPLSAMEMERQGSAKVKFRLFPSGKIENLRMIQSSGTDSLDQAALAAVQNAAPFTEIHRHLTAAQEFSIDVVFELA